MRTVLLSILALIVVSAQELPPPGVRVSDDVYPRHATTSVVRFFHLATDSPDLVELEAALSEHGAELVYGPCTTSGRPGHAFVALRAPRDASVKKLAAALKKGGGAAEELVCVAFDGRTGKDHDFGLGAMGVTKRDFVMGMSGDIVWYDAHGPWSQIYGRPGKLEARELAERYEKLYAPYGGAKLGELVTERFHWTLDATPDDKVRAKLSKSFEKIRGVREAAFDGAGLTMTIALDGLGASADAGKIQSAQGEPLDEAGRDAPRLAFDAGEVYELLKAEKLVP